MKSSLSEYEKGTLLYELYQQKMYAVAYGILHDVYQAEDAVQEAFLKLIHNIRKIKNPKSDETKRYVIRVIQSCAIDSYRKNQKDFRRFTVISDTDSERASDAGDSIDSMIEKMEDKEHFHKLVDTLPEPYRATFVCRYVKQLSVKETAERLCINEALVRKRCERAKALLKKMMGDDMYETKII